MGAASPPTATATELLAAYRARELSPVEVAEAALDAIEADERGVNAFCLVDREGALAQARESEKRWAANAPQGKLDGVPVAVKDLLLTRGQPTRRGSRVVDPDQPWEDDAPVVAALRRNGAVIPGKTTTPELGWKGVTDSLLTGVTRNPWDPTKTAGGSSGGSSAALSAGMVPLALGTDGGGSIRIPCGFCGLAGIKPTYGRVPAWPASPFGTVAHVGPMARTVTDTALLLDVLSEPDHRDWNALPRPERSFLDGLDEGVRGLKIAFSPTLGFATVDPGLAAAVEAAVGVLQTAGAVIEQVDPGFPDPRETYETMWFAGAASALAALGDPPPDTIDPGLAAIAEQGRKTSIVDYLAALQARDRLATTMSEFLTRYDLLVTPTVPIVAFEAGREVPDGWPDERWPSWTPFTYPFNLTQQPAATVPCGFVRNLPVGLQIVGPRHADARVLQAARAYEAAAPQPTVV